MCKNEFIILSQPDSSSPDAIIYALFGLTANELAEQIVENKSREYDWLLYPEET